MRPDRGATGSGRQGIEMTKVVLRAARLARVVALVAAGLALSGCMMATVYEKAPGVPKDKGGEKVVPQIRVGHSTSIVPLAAITAV